MTTCADWQPTYPLAHAGTLISGATRAKFPDLWAVIRNGVIASAQMFAMKTGRYEMGLLALRLCWHRSTYAGKQARRKSAASSGGACNGHWEWNSRTGISAVSLREQFLALLCWRTVFSSSTQPQFAFKSYGCLSSVSIFPADSVHKQGRFGLSLRDHSKNFRRG